MIADRLAPYTALHSSWEWTLPAEFQVSPVAAPSSSFVVQTRNPAATGESLADRIRRLHALQQPTIGGIRR